MPIYEYVCTYGHVTEQRGGYDDATILCRAAIEAFDRFLCGEVATRRPGYQSQGVIFKGTGFTRTVIPPAPPTKTTIPGEPVNDWAEKTDTYVRESYKDDNNYRDERKKQAKEMLKQIEKGGIA